MGVSSQTKPNNKQSNNNQVSSSEPKSKKFVEAYKRNIWLYGGIFIIGAFACFFLGLYVRSTHPLRSDFLNLLAGSALTVGIFSILIGFPDFINYVIHRLREIIIEREYLKILSDDEKERLKKDLDEELYGKDAIKDQDSLYHFIDEKLSLMYKSSYRSNFIDEFTLFSSDIDDYWLVQNYTSYVYHKEKRDPEPFAISFAHRCDLIDQPKLKPEDILKDIKLSIGPEKFQLIKNGDCYLEPQDNEYLKDNIKINHKQLKDREKLIAEIKFNIEISDDIFESTKKRNIIIIANSEFFVHKRDNTFTLRMNKPTKTLFFSCRLMDGNYKMESTGFGFNPRSHTAITRSNFASVDIKEWLLPGHGAVISWLPI